MMCNIVQGVMYTVLIGGNDKKCFDESDRVSSPAKFGSQLAVFVANVTSLLHAQ